MQKAFKWLAQHKMAYEFHNYKELGIDQSTLNKWLKNFATNELINTKGTTFKALSAEEKLSITKKPAAIQLMIKYPSLIKRPVWDFGNSKYLLGFKEVEMNQLIDTI